MPFANLVNCKKELTMIERPGEDETIADGDESSMVDLSEAGEFKFEALPKGDYNVIVDSCDYGLSQSSQQPMWTVILEVEDGEYAKRKVYTHLSFSPKALPGTNSALKILKPDLFSKKFDAKKVAEDGDMLGQRARVRLGIEKYQDQLQNRVKRWMPAVGASLGGEAGKSGNAFLADNS